MPDTNQNNTFAENISCNQYFQSLPPYVQENIMQSGVKISCEEELKQCVNHLMQK